MSFEQLLLIFSSRDLRKMCTLDFEVDARSTILLCVNPSTKHRLDNLDNASLNANARTESIAVRREWTIFAAHYAVLQCELMHSSASVDAMMSWCNAFLAPKTLPCFCLLVTLFCWDDECIESSSHEFRHRCYDILSPRFSMIIRGSGTLPWHWERLPRVAWGSLAVMFATPQGLRLYCIVALAIRYCVLRPKIGHLIDNNFSHLLV